MITVEGKNGIKATVLAHSITKAGKGFITWEAEYPRPILAEMNTHRQPSRNSYSSRAVPFNKMVEQLKGVIVRFGANQPGMQDKGEDYDAPVDIGPAMGFSHSYKVGPKEAWEMAKQSAIKFSKAFADAGYHKQVYNRLVETWQMQKTVFSATETDNFFWLRDDDAADPTIRELARVMKQAMEQSAPQELEPGEWHLPYIDTVKPFDKRLYWITHDDGVIEYLTVEQAIKVSCARCAAVSYRNEGYGLEKSIEIYDKLVGSEKKHASAFEHCATPMKERFIGEPTLSQCINLIRIPNTWEEGITHMDRNGNLWSGNLQGWIQFRKLIPGECYNAE